mmetsp:Transcript_3579/g.7218  ORF Transcript_3579/g.7218 Transcript_3579/m.7218 type:complete len:295 (+) Transcript_3579:421-1305(+)
MLLFSLSWSCTWISIFLYSFMFVLSAVLRAEIFFFRFIRESPLLFDASWPFWIISRRWIERSICWIISSWCFLSAASRSSMRWISFFIPLISGCPNSGSRAACVSRSSCIFFSSIMTCFSASMTFRIASSFSFFRASILFVWACAASARTLSSLEKSFSFEKFSDLSSFTKSSDSAMSLFSFPASKCSRRSCAVRACDSAASCLCSLRNLRFFCSSTLMRERISLTFFSTFSVSATMLTRLFWLPIHRLCSERVSLLLFSMSRLSVLMTASRGPVFSSCWFAVASSYFLFSRAM